MKAYVFSIFVAIIIWSTYQLPAQSQEHPRWNIELSNQEAFTQQTSPSADVPEFSGAINPDQIANKNTFQSLSKIEQQTLEKHHFAVSETQCVEMYDLYKDNIMPFITTDFIYHAYMVLLQDNLKEAEKYILSNELDFFLNETYNQLLKMEATIPEQGKKILQEAQVEIAASCQILNPKFIPPDRIKLLVKAKTMDANSRFNQYIDPPSDKDHSNSYQPAELIQRIPLKNYHLAVRYLSSAHSLGEDDDIQQFLLITLAMKSSQEALVSYNNYTDFTEALAGQKEDIALSFFLNKFPEFTVNDVFDKTFLEEVKSAITKEPMPVIIDDPSFGVGTARNIRIIPPRVTLKNFIFDKIGKENFQNGANLPDSGKFILSYFHFPAKTTKRELKIFNPLYNELRQDHIANPYQVPSIYNHALITLSTLNLHPGPEHPSFQKSPYWKFKEMNTFLGGWTELEKITSLYTKMNMYPLCGEMERQVPFGYVEPVPEFYKRLNITVKNTQKLFAGIGAFNEEYQKSPYPFKKENFEHLISTLEIIEDITQKELTNTPLNEQEKYFFQDFKNNAEDLCQRHKCFGTDSLEPTHKLCFLIHNRPKGIKAYSATGKPYCIYVVAPYGNRLQICKGAIYSYYEFTKPDSMKLKTKDWTAQSKYGYTCFGETPILEHKNMVMKQRSTNHPQQNNHRQPRRTRR